MSFNFISFKILQKEINLRALITVPFFQNISGAFLSFGLGDVLDMLCFPPAFICMYTYILGWRPRRTVLFASWDAEEFGLLGSTEWAEVS